MYPSCSKPRMISKHHKDVSPKDIDEIQNKFNDSQSKPLIIIDKKTEAAIKGVKEFCNKYNIDHTFYGTIVKVLQDITEDELRKFGYKSPELRAKFFKTIYKLHLVPNDIVMSVASPNHPPQSQYEQSKKKIVVWNNYRVQ